MKERNPSDIDYQSVSSRLEQAGFTTSEPKPIKMLPHPSPEEPIENIPDEDGKTKKTLTVLALAAVAWSVFK